MGRTIDGIKTINASVRTGLLAVLVATIGYFGFSFYSQYTAKDRLVQDQQEKIRLADEKMAGLRDEVALQAGEITELSADVAEKVKQIAKLETSMHLLKTDQRLAQLRVIEIERDDAGEAIRSTLEFTELSSQGEKLSDPKRFSLPGDVVYIDNWIVKFDDSYIERGDIQRGTSLCLFRRIFSEQQIPTEGVSLDEIGMRPQAYARGGAMSKFETELWADFWQFANDREKASAMGIRAANGEAISIKVQDGQTYGVSLRASGGTSIGPVDVPE